MSNGKRNVQWIVERETGSVCTILQNVFRNMPGTKMLK